MPLIPALRKQRQVDLCEFEDSLVYKVTARALLHRETLSQTHTHTHTHTHTPSRIATFSIPPTIPSSLSTEVTLT